MKRQHTLCTALLLHALLSSSVYAQVQPLDGLDVYIKQAMQEWKVSGIALAIVEGDSVVLAKGYGVRDLNTGSSGS